MGPGVHRLAPIEMVREGMTVVDRAGDKLGTVGIVQMGDPEAVTKEGNDLPEPGIIGDIGMALFGDEREPDVPEPFRSQLLRYGFIKVDGPGLADSDRYVRSDLIAEVRDDTVFLNVARDELPKEV